MGKISSLTDVRRAQIVTLHRERYTERDIAAKLRCPKTSVHNVINKFNVDGTFHDRERSGRSGKTTPREDRLMRHILMCWPKNPVRKSVLFYV